MGNNSIGMSKTAGRAGTFLGLVGLILFLAGIFGAPRVLAFTGLAMIVASYAAFFIEESSNRQRRASLGEQKRPV